MHDGLAKESFSYAIIDAILIVFIPVMRYAHHVGAQCEGFVYQPAA